MSNRGLFISFEGSEGSGKSTQSKMLFDFLKKSGFKVVHLWDPGSTLLGESIREILLHSRKRRSAFSETMLYLTARTQLVEEKIMPALSQNTIVICDRFADATVAYQGYGLGVDIKTIGNMNRYATKSIMPDITFLLDVDVRKGLKRCKRVKGFADRIERRRIDFHRRVRDGYRILAKKSPRRIKRIDIETNDKDQTQSIIRKAVLDAIKRYNRPKKSHRVS